MDDPATLCETVQRTVTIEPHAVAGPRSRSSTPADRIAAVRHTRTIPCVGGVTAPHERR